MVRASGGRAIVRGGQSPYTRSDVHPTEEVPFAEVVRERRISCVYQPVIALDSGDTIGYEALARGPTGSRWFAPDVLVEHAGRVGALPEVDWICRAAACRGALAANLPDHLSLFVNIEPASSRIDCPADLVGVITEALDRFPIVAEVTERSLTHDPAGLLDVVRVLRAHRNRIALDDVGAVSASQALMSLLRPDIVKLDRSVIQAPDSPASTSVLAAVQSEVARTGAVILAEGIETATHLDTARSMGATLGQGWLLGHPGPLPRDFPGPTFALPRLGSPAPDAATPWHVASARHAPARVSKAKVLSVSRTLEGRGVSATEPTVVLASFQHVDNFSGPTRRRYANLAHRGIFTAAYAAGMPRQPAPEVRGCPLGPDDDLVREWNVIVIGSQFAAGLFARQVNDLTHPHAFELVVSEDRDLVLAAAHPLMGRLAPAS